MVRQGLLLILPWTVRLSTKPALSDLSPEGMGRRRRWSCGRRPLPGQAKTRLAAAETHHGEDPPGQRFGKRGKVCGRLYRLVGQGRSRRLCGRGAFGDRSCRLRPDDLRSTRWKQWSAVHLNQTVNQSHWWPSGSTRRRPRQGPCGRFAGVPGQRPPVRLGARDRDERRIQGWDGACCCGADCA